VVRLVRDYRSTPQVVSLANRIVRAGSAGPAGAADPAGTADLVAQRPPGPEPSVFRYPDDEAEAAAVAAEAGMLIARGVPPREIAILLRINGQLERFERALAAAQVPYVVRGAERFYERPEVRQALVLLRGAARAEGADTDAETVAAGGLAAAVRHVLASAGLTAEPPGAGGGARGAARDRWESLAALAGLADDLAAARPEASLADFAAELAERADTGHAPVASAVTVATMHAAKGLEWDAVLLPGLVEGIMPIVHARTAEGIEEERRLLYVAVTRSRKHLALSWAPVRAPGAGQARQRSRFLAGLTPASEPAAAPAGAPGSAPASAPAATGAVPGVRR
jgi:DNA helicase-2/ATP-dependent DNA helicase PcrA